MKLNRAALAAILGVSGPMLVITGFWLLGWNPVASYFIALAVMTFGTIVAISGGMSRGRAEQQGLDVDAARFMLTPELYDQGARAEAAFRVDEPTFSRARLLATAETLAARLGAGDLAAIHPFVSDGLFQRLSTQQRMGSPAAEFTVFARLQVKGTMVTDFSVGSQYQSVQLRLTLGDGDEAQTVALSFLRRRLAHTRAFGLAESKCPHCGAPLELSATQRCRFCEAIVNSGAHDWVLVALTPGVETLTRQGDVLDLENVRALDPELSAEELCDRATLTFWRWVEARQSGVQRRLVRVASQEFLEHLELFPAPTGFVTNGGSELRMLRSRAGFDEAHVAVRWAEAWEGEARSHHTVFKLRRPLGKRAPSAMGLSTLRCLGCLAAVTDAESPLCDYCGASLQDAWCLFDVEPYASWSEAATALRKAIGSDWSRAATPAQREAAMSLLVSVAKADGAVPEDERARLDAIAARWQLPPGQLQAMLSATTVPTPLRLPRDLAVSLTQELVQLAFLGDQIEPRERKRLEAIAVGLGMESELSRSLARLTASRLKARS